jgi:hypothetical protein
VSPHGKGGHADTLPLGFEYVRTALELHLREREAGEYLPGLSTEWGLHDLRHAAADAPHRATGDLVLAQRLLRHSDIRTTRGYLHPDSNGSQRTCGKPKPNSCVQNSRLGAHSR